VAAAVALAVLDVVQEEGLQENAAEVGAYVMSGLRELATHHEVMGDVRGAGLMIGVELVLNRGERKPASDAAAGISNAMRERGVLIGTTGPQSNVLKIRPPLVFSRENADQLIGTLDELLGQS
jgi:4-aminobutyrate aminotransferase-like enzyme